MKNANSRSIPKGIRRQTGTMILCASWHVWDAKKQAYKIFYDSQHGGSWKSAQAALDYLLALPSPNHTPKQGRSATLSPDRAVFVRRKGVYRIRTTISYRGKLNVKVFTGTDPDQVAAYALQWRQEQEMLKLQDWSEDQAKRIDLFKKLHCRKPK